MDHTTTGVRWFWAATTAIALTTALPACDEPVDCGAGPGRCLQTEAAQRQVGARVTMDGRPPKIAQPVDLKRHVPQPPRALNPAKTGQPANAGDAKEERQNAAQPPGDPRRRQFNPLAAANLGAPVAGRPLKPTDDIEHHAQVVYNTRKTPAELMRRIMNVAANRNVVGLKRFCTPTLDKNIDEMLEEHKERFWRHLDKYVTAANDGFTLEEAPGSSDVTRQLTVKTRAGTVLKPIVAKDGKGWLFERF